MNRPRLFLSAVSEELRTVRRSVAATVRTLGFDPVSQDDFPTGYGELRQWLREQIDSCEGLVQIVGEGYGAEPAEVDADYGRLSYTQFEFRYAQRRGKKTWIIIAGEHCQRDTQPAQLDLPRDPAQPNPAGYQAERRQLQQDYLARLRKENHLRYSADSDTELQNVVLRLRDELGELRIRAERQQSRLAKAIIAILCGLLLLGGGGWWAYQRLHIGVQQVGVVNTEKIRAHLRETVEATHRRELAAADEAPDWKQRQRLREAAEAAHTVRLGRIDELASSFAEIEGRGQATSVFQEMTRILTGQGVDEAIAYVASQRASILQTVQARAATARERNRADLQPLLQAAALHQNKGQSIEARALYKDVLMTEPDWPAALHAYFWFLANQGDAARTHTTLAAAEHEYDEAHRLALRLTSADPSNIDWQRDLFASYTKLGDVAVAQGKLDAAARTYGDCLAIAKKLAESDPSNTGWQRDLSFSFFQLSKLQAQQKQWPEAIANAEASLEIDERLSQLDPSNANWRSDVTASRAWLDQLRQEAAAR